MGVQNHAQVLREIKVLQRFFVVVAHFCYLVHSNSVLDMTWLASYSPHRSPTIHAPSLSKPRETQSEPFFLCVFGGWRKALCKCGFFQISSHMLSHLVESGKVPPLTNIQFHGWIFVFQCLLELLFPTNVLLPSSCQNLSAVTTMASMNMKIERFL